jgi:hypothetical protein
LARLAVNFKNAGNGGFFDVFEVPQLENGWKMDTGFIIPWVLLGSLTERFKRGLQPLQPATHRLSGSANPEAEVFWSLEEFSWHHAGVERVAQGSH